MPTRYSATSMYHETHEEQREFERYMKTTDGQKALETLAGSLVGLGAKPGTLKPQDVIKALWALSIEHNDQLKIKRVAQDIRFQDVPFSPTRKPELLPIVWKIIKSNLPDALKTIPDAERAVIEAYAQVDLIHLLDYFGIMSVDIDTDGDGTATESKYARYVHLVNDEENPLPNYVYGTNTAGTKGWKPASAGYIDVTFAYTDFPGSIIVGNLPAYKRIKRVTIEVTTEFDDDAYIHIGYDYDEGAVVPDDFYITDAEITYHYDMDVFFAIDREIKVFLKNNPTVGEATVIIYYQ